ncbi:metallophosphoesterase [Hymenobacter psychrotolerans]|uniref:metallophosphoesterase n=1 Tax=Hymenobacter psychrotolerans TaxID=344998 RepID=UPI00147E9207|nr:metallophosphoesterase [Hymenobacter psychrotolerans]
MLLVILYVGGGIGLIALGVIDKFYFLPGWSIKGPNATKDRSGFAADGPVVYYQGATLISWQIAPRNGKLQLLTDTLKADAVLTCFVSETNRQFRVPLRPTPAQPEVAEYAAVPKLLALSDIEGNFKGFEQLLRGAGVVDQNLNWQYGQGHLVLVGDFFDRGLNVTECLWLMYKLEQEAVQAGGKVHFIVGNHERMNLTGHYKYLRRKYRANADTLGLPYEKWYGSHSLLGRWLRTKNVVERIGTTLFAHGGISPELAAQNLPLTRLNDLARYSLDVPVAHLTPQEKQATQPPTSPDWYRGLAQEKPAEVQVDQVLKTYGATTMVIGHTPVEAIKPLYHGKIIAIDLPHQERCDAGQPLQALLIENGKLSVVDSQGKRQALAAE